MSDLETRLTEALADGAQEAPSAVGLAGAARDRARRRRRTRIGAAAAVVALGVAVPTAVVVAGGSDRDRRPDAGTVATDPAPPGRTLPGGFHYESWHGVTIEVPDSWRHGTINQWCVAGEPQAPIIQRPGGVSTEVACEPAFGYGVSFQQIDRSDEFRWPLALQGSGWPADAYVGAHGLGGVLIEVSLADINLAQQILDSARLNPSLDPNGCPVDTNTDPVVPADSMSVCRYDAGGQLEQSELLTGDEAARAEAALGSAAGERGGSDCATDAPVVQTIRLASIAQDANVVLTDACAELFVHGGLHPLSQDVLYWALSPGWSGSVPDGVSLPSELRTD